LCGVVIHIVGVTVIAVGKMQRISVSSEAAADSLQELKGSAIPFGFKLCPARRDACFVQNVSFLLWPRDAIDDADGIVHILDSCFLQMTNESE